MDQKFYDLLESNPVCLLYTSAKDHGILSRGRGDQSGDQGHEAACIPGIGKIPGACFLSGLFLLERLVRQDKKPVVVSDSLCYNRINSENITNQYRKECIYGQSDQQSGGRF